MTKKKLDTGSYIPTWQVYKNLCEVLSDLCDELFIIRFLLFIFIALEVFACGFTLYLFFLG